MPTYAMAVLGANVFRLSWTHFIFTNTLLHRVNSRLPPLLPHSRQNVYVSLRHCNTPPETNGVDLMYPVKTKCSTTDTYTICVPKMEALCKHAA